MWIRAKYYLLAGWNNFIRNILSPISNISFILRIYIVNFTNFFKIIFSSSSWRKKCSPSLCQLKLPILNPRERNITNIFDPFAGELIYRIHEIRIWNELFIDKSHDQRIAVKVGNGSEENPKSGRVLLENLSKAPTKHVWLSAKLWNIAHNSIYGCPVDINGKWEVFLKQHGLRWADSEA